MRIPIKLIFAALLFSFVTSVYGGQEVRVLRNRDFKIPPRQGIITNKDLKKYSQSLKRSEARDQIKITRPRRATFNSEQASKTSLLSRKAVLEEKIEVLQSELNDLNTRTLQNRPPNPLTVGDPYYVDPKIRERITLLKSRLTNAQLEYQSILNKLEGQ
jgi:hypothetical protein